GQVSDCFGYGLQHDSDLTGIQALAPHYFNRLPSPATAVDFTTLCGQLDWSRALITRHELDRKAEGCLDQFSTVVIGGTWSAATQFDRSLRRHPCINTSDPARFCKGTNDMIFYWHPNPLKLSRIEFDSTIPEKLLGNQIANKISDGQTIRLGRLVNRVGGDETARPGDVINNHCRIARYIFA